MKDESLLELKRNSIKDTQSRTSNNIVAWWKKNIGNDKEFKKFKDNTNCSVANNMITS